MTMGGPVRVGLFSQRRKRRRRHGRAGLAECMQFLVGDITRGQVGRCRAKVRSVAIPARELGASSHRATAAANDEHATGVDTEDGGIETSCDARASLGLVAGRGRPQHRRLGSVGSQLLDVKRPQACQLRRCRHIVNEG